MGIVEGNVGFKGSEADKGIRANKAGKGKATKFKYIHAERLGYRFQNIRVLLSLSL